MTRTRRPAPATRLPRLAWPAAVPGPTPDPGVRRALRVELVVLLAVTFGLSGLYSVLDLVASLVAPEPLAQQTTTLNATRSTDGALDAAYQLLGVVRLLAWAALPLVLLHGSGVGPRVVGLVRERLGRQVLAGLGLAAVIGIPGLGLYLVAVAAGLNLQVAPSGLTATWWRPLVLCLSAAANGAAEEVLVVGYVLVRLRRLGWSPYAAVAASALLRGSYHLYQGFGGGLGNLAMGVVCGLWWLRTRRLLPLVVAHTVLDVCAFCGYAYLAPHVGWL